MTARMGLPWIVEHMYTPLKAGSAKKCLFCFYLALYDEILIVSISREPYAILNWLTIQNDRKTHLSISV